MTITVSANRQIQGQGWVMYMRHKKRIPKIFYDIWLDLQSKKDKLKWEEIPEQIEQVEATSLSKAYRRVSSWRNIIEVSQQKGMPILWIVKEDYT